MTDKEIEKALETCGESPRVHCRQCPYFQHNAACLIRMEKDALDYINRLKVENEKLKETLNAIENDEINLRGNLDQLVDELKQIRKDTAKEILQNLFDIANKGAKDDNNDFAYACMQMKVHIRFKAKEYDVEVDDE